MSKPLAHESLKLIRHKMRPTIRDYIPLIFDEFVEMHGDRAFADDSAICGGIALLRGVPVTVIGHDKGRNLEERKKTNFAMAHPEGYRKAMRLVRQAEKFHRPVIFFVDTPGAYAGVGAEERGQGIAIAENLYDLIDVRTPMVMCVLGEGGSGGALALGVCDKVGMLSNALYSVLSPKAFASLVWKDPSKENQAADIMRITADDLKQLGVIDAIVEEPVGGAHRSPRVTGMHLKHFLMDSIEELMEKPVDILLENRYDKFRKIGVYHE